MQQQPWKREIAKCRSIKAMQKATYANPAIAVMIQDLKNFKSFHEIILVHKKLLNKPTEKKTYRFLTWERGTVIEYFKARSCTIMDIKQV